MIPIAGELARRREALVWRSAEQRRAVAAACGPFTSKLSAADRIWDGVRRHPVAAALAAIALAFLGRRKLLAWAARGLAAWSLLRRL